MPFEKSTVAGVGLPSIRLLGRWISRQGPAVGESTIRRSDVHVRRALGARQRSDHQALPAGLRPHILW